MENEESCLEFIDHEWINERNQGTEILLEALYSQTVFFQSKVMRDKLSTMLSSHGPTMKIFLKILSRAILNRSCYRSDGNEVMEITDQKSRFGFFFDLDWIIQLWRLSNPITLDFITEFLHQLNDDVFLASSWLHSVQKLEAYLFLLKSTCRSLIQERLFSMSLKDTVLEWKRFERGKYYRVLRKEFDETLSEIALALECC